jgi:formyl-CoA transferase
MGTSEHAYGLVMRALYERAVTGKGSRIDLAMMDSTVSWLTQPITMAKTFGKNMTRRGNTHEFFSPVSVYPTRNSYVYMAMGNDIQWQRLLKIKGFEGIEDEAYASNAGRIANVGELNEKISAVTRNWDTEELLAVLREGLIPVAKVQTVAEVCEDVAVRDKLLSSTDPVSGMSVTHAPPPYMSQYLKENERKLSFPPRLGEHNRKIYGDVLGISNEDFDQLKTSGVI